LISEILRPTNQARQARRARVHDGSLAAAPDTARRRARGQRWPDLMRRTFGFDELACPRCGVSDELQRRQDRLLERRNKQAGFRDADRALGSFDFDFNKKMNRAVVFDLATAAFVGRREDALFLGPPGTGKCHFA
jgi:DNA replication protein DnaC